MQRSFGRTDRLADAIQKELAVLIRDQMRDPRVGMVTLTGVEVSRDLNYAKVYFTQVDLDEGEIGEVVAVLNGAAGFLRTKLSKIMDIRTTPRLKFHFDHSGRYGQKMSALIDQAISSDDAMRAASGSDSNENADDSQENSSDEG